MLAGIPDPVPADTLALLQSTRLANMDFFGSAYLTHELRIQSSVPVDLAVAFGEGGPPIPLQDGDKVYVPRDNNQVFVFGQVNRPGYVTHRAGMSPQYYVSAASGLGENAGTSYVIKAGTNRFVRSSEAEVESGDWIFVNRKTVLADTEDMQRLLTEDERLRIDKQGRIWQAVIATTQVATIVIVQLLTR